MPFDPDPIAIATGEGHLIPPNVKPLTLAQRHDWYPDTFHALHGRESCVCPKEAPRARALSRRRGTLGGVEV